MHSILAFSRKKRGSIIPKNIGWAARVPGGLENWAGETHAPDQAVDLLCRTRCCRLRQLLMPVLLNCQCRRCGGRSSQPAAGPAGPGAPSAAPPEGAPCSPSPVCASLAPDSKSGLDASERLSLGQHCILAAREAVKARACQVLHPPTSVHYEENSPNLGRRLKTWLVKESKKWNIPR